MKVDKETAKKALSDVLSALENFDRFDETEALKNHLMELIQKLGMKNGQVLWPTRVALTGEPFSPGVFEIMWALGKEKSLERIRKGLATL